VGHHLHLTTGAQISVLDHKVKLVFLIRHIFVIVMHHPLLYGPMLHALLQLDDRLSTACGLLTSCLHGNAGAVRRQLPQLVPHMTSLMSSALAAPRLAEVFVALSDAAFETRDRCIDMIVSLLLLLLLFLLLSSIGFYCLCISTVSLLCFYFTLLIGSSSAPLIRSQRF